MLPSSTAGDIMRIQLPITALILFIGVPLASARADCPPDVNRGAWSPESNFTANPIPSLGCYRMYICGPEQQVMYDANCRLAATPPLGVTGVCTAGGGDISSCNACLTNPPSDPCQWHLEQR